jgi:predicted HTH transcriptional regulator
LLPPETAFTKPRQYRKEELSSKPDRLVKQPSAFSNQVGGRFLVFGVTDRGEVVGLSDESQSAITETIANLARTAVEPQINVQPFSFHFRGKALLGIYIPESVDKPVYRLGKMEESYIRAGGLSSLMHQSRLV